MEEIMKEPKKAKYKVGDKIMIEETRLPEIIRRIHLIGGEFYYNAYFSYKETRFFGIKEEDILGKIPKEKGEETE
jgi:hypothetical protein